jgi:poly(3-hydroxyalkanoate) synthetase
LTPVELGHARVPILLAYGDRDVFVPLQHAVSLHRQLPDSRLLIVPDSGHVSMVNQPAVFNAAASAFWRATAAEARDRAGAGAGSLDPGLTAHGSQEEKR